MGRDRFADFSDPDWIVRYRAVVAVAGASWSRELGSRPAPGDPSAIDRLLRLADDPVKNVRNIVALALGAIAETAHGREARERLAAALTDPNWRLRFAAARAYEWLRPEPGEPLHPLVDDPFESVRWAAARVLVGRIPDQTVVGPLLRATQDPAPTVRAVALGVAAVRDERALDAALAALHDPDGRVRQSAAAALVDERAVPALIQALGDPHARVRASAAGSLGRLHATEAVEPLLALLHAKSRRTRADAADALGEIGDTRAVDPLVELFERSSNLRVRLAAIHALGRLRDPRAISVLRVAAADTTLERGSDDPRFLPVRRAANEALREIRGRRLRRLLGGAWSPHN